MSTLVWRLTPVTDAPRKTLYADEIPVVTNGRVKIRLLRAIREKTDSLVVGKDPRVAWSGDRWILDLPLGSAGAGMPALDPGLTGVLGIRNATPDCIGVVLRNGAGESLGSWIFDPGDGSQEPLGSKLVDGDVEMQVKPGFTLDLTRERHETLCDHTLADCPLASFDRHARRWLIRSR